jgi:hypothetical protein
MRLDAGMDAGQAGTAQCAATRLALQPAIDAGQAGIVLEAWLAARACASHGRISSSDVQTLTAGGYRPQSTGFSTQFNLGRHHEQYGSSSDNRVSIR